MNIDPNFNKPFSKKVHFLRSAYLYCSLLAASAVCALVVYLQLGSLYMWPLLNGSGYHDNVYRGCITTAGLLILTMLSLAVKSNDISRLQKYPLFRMLQVATAVMGGLAIYPMATDYFYDLPAWISWLVVIFAALSTGLSIWSARFLAMQFGVLCVVIGAYQNAPHFMWDITDTNHLLNTYALLIAFVTLATLSSLLSSTGVAKQTRNVLFRVFCNALKPSKQTFFLLLGFAVITPYVFSAIAKVYFSSDTVWRVDGISWIWKENLGNLFRWCYYYGCHWLPPSISADFVFQSLELSSIPANALVLISEATVIFLIISKRITVWSLLFLQFFHVFVTPIAGVYFWYWFVVNTIFLFFYMKKSQDIVWRNISFCQRIVLTCVALVVSPLIFHMSALGWIDPPNIQVFSWHMVTDESVDHQDPLSFTDTTTGEKFVAINPNTFYPYEKNFGMSWRFQRILDGFNLDGNIQAQNALLGKTKEPYIKDISSTIRKRASQQSANPPEVPTLADWYKWRVASDTYYHGLMPKDPYRLIQTLDSFFPKYHARKHRRVISSPPFYTHIFYNPWTLKEDIARDNSVRGYALVKHTISPHDGALHGGVVKEILYRYDLPNQENQFVQK